MLSVLVYHGLLGVCLAAPQDGVVKKEVADWQGIWEIVRGEEDNEPFPQYIVRNLKFRIQGDRLLLQGVNFLESIELKFTLDPAASPKAVDFRFETGDDKGRMVVGIYEVNGEGLRLCVRRAANERPGEFTTNAGSRCVLLVLRRKR